MTSIELLAPAKVNLFLKILKKRKDGYHDIYTLFERIDIADKIKLTKIPLGIKIHSDSYITPKQSDNIAYKAADILIKNKKIKSGVSIDIEKNIPIAAGMGGGSSDAASVLIGMNKLFALGIKNPEMAKIALRLGADVPFFIKEMSFAVGKGVGDRLKKANIGKKLWHLVVYPGFKSATKGIYEAFDKGPFALTQNRRDVRIQPCFATPVDFGALEAMLYNDLQVAAVTKNRALDGIIKRLASLLGKRIILSGSGPSLFCLYKDRKEAISAGKELRKGIPAADRKSWKIFVTGTL